MGDAPPTSTPAALPFELYVLPRNKVARIVLSKSRGPRLKTLISIGDPGSRIPGGFARVTHRLPRVRGRPRGLERSGRARMRVHPADNG